MINTQDILGDATDFDRGLFISALDKRLLIVAEYDASASYETNQKKLVSLLKEKVNAQSLEFTPNELKYFFSILDDFGSELLTADADLYDDATLDKMHASLTKFSRRHDDYLDQTL